MGSTPHAPEGKQQDKIIIFCGGTPGPAGRPRLIAQQDLIEERLLTIAAGQALRALREKRGRIIALLQAGAPVEAGPHSCRFLEVSVEGYEVAAGVRKRLIVE